MHLKYVMDKQWPEIVKENNDLEANFPTLCIERVLGSKSIVGFILEYLVSPQVYKHIFIRANQAAAATIHPTTWSQT